MKDHTSVVGIISTADRMMPKEDFITPPAYPEDDPVGAGKVGKWMQQKLVYGIKAFDCDPKQITAVEMADFLMGLGKPKEEDPNGQGD